MTRGRAAIVVGLCTLGLSVAVFAQMGAQGAASASQEQQFRVTSWPDHRSAEADYGEEVETFLNKMASEGWVLHSTASAQKQSFLVFTRTEKR